MIWQRYDSGWESIGNDGYIVRVEPKSDGDGWIAYGGEENWQLGPFATSEEARDAVQDGPRMYDAAELARHDGET